MAKQAEKDGIRWYHIVATATVLVLAVYAGSLVFRRFDFSMIGNTKNMKISVGCNEEELRDYRFFGIEDGRFYRLDDGIKPVEAEDDAQLQIVSVGNKTQLRIKTDAGWEDEQLYSGEEKTYTVSDTEQCKLQARILISL